MHRANRRTRPVPAIAGLLAVALLASLIGPSGGVVWAALPPVAATFAQGGVPVGAGAWSVATGDVDGDGVLDVATANKDADTVSVALGNGDGTFATHVEYGVGDTPLSVAMGDLDGDGDLDLATADQGSVTVSILLGNGDGTFAPASGLALDAFPRDVTTGDVDGDGDLDLAVATFGVSATRGVSVLLGNGDGTFGPPQTAHAISGGSNDVALADVDGDATLDLITADGSPHTVSVLLGDGAGGFSLHASLATHATLIGPSSVGAADLDADGDLDLVTANRFNSVSVLLGDGDGSFAGPVSYNAGLEPTDVVVADLNGDTHADLAVADVVRGASVLLGFGDGTFGPATIVTFPAGISGIAVAVGDLNGDAFPDLALARDDLRVLVNTTGLALAAPVATAGSTGVTLSWTPPVAAATVTGYVVTPDDGSRPLPPVTFSSTATTQAIPGLTNGVTYTFSVAATNVLGAGPSSGSSNAVLQATGLLPPTIGAATAVNGTATVSWTAPASDGGSPVTGYVVTPYIGYLPLAPQSFGSTATVQVLTGLTNGTQYRFRVQATNAFGNSGYSRVTNPVTPAPPTAPGAPTIGSATAANGEATVSWLAPVSDGGSPITGYVVTPYVGYYPLPARTFDSTATSQVVTGLTNGTQYRFRVQATNAVGSGGYSTASNAVTPTA